MRRDASLKWCTLRKQSNTIWVVMQRHHFLVVSENAVFIMCGVKRIRRNLIVPRENYEVIIIVISKADNQKTFPWYALLGGNVK